MHSDPALADRAPLLNFGPALALARRRFRWLWRALARGRGLTLLLVALLGVVRVWDPQPVEIVRLKAFDYMQRLLPVDEAPILVPVVTIDEASLRQLGQWPWSRKLISELLTRLMQAGAAVVGFDIVFAEPDRLSPGTLAREIAGLNPVTLAELELLPSNDSVFAETLKRSRAVLGRFAGTAGEVAAGGVLRKATFATIGPDPRPMMLAFGSLVSNLPQIEAAASGIGFISLEPEHDNLVRRVPSVIRIGDAILPTLSIEMLRVATGQRAIAVKSNAAGMTSLVIAGVEVPVDENGRMWLRALRHRPERYISAVDLLTGRVDAAMIAGRPVLIGATAAGLQDLRSTSLASNLPGVEVHAHLIENIIGQRHLFRPNYGYVMELSITLAVGLLLVVFLPMLGARWTLAALLAVGGAVLGGSVYLLRAELLLVDPSYPLLSATLIYGFLVYASYISEERQRLFIRNAFGQYLSPALVERLANDPEILKLGGDTREMTFLFSDVRGFTAISEGFKGDPQGLTRLINRFLTPMTDIIMARQGTIDKYMGDCIMAFWNAPIDDAEHARHACESALAMIAELEALNGRLQAEAEAEGRSFQALRIGIGINTGTCVVGNMGSEQRFDYSVLGDAVNLASRLEGLSKLYDVTIVAGEDTAGKLPDLPWLELDLIAVKGKREGARVHTLLGERAASDSDAYRLLRARQTEMLAAYRAQEWDRAEALLAQVRGLWSGLDGLADAYLERIAFFRQNPPGPAWDGVHVAETK
jgi:adenylate cyclase